MVSWTHLKKIFISFSLPEMHFRDCLYMPLVQRNMTLTLVWAWTHNVPATAETSCNEECKVRSFCTIINFLLRWIWTRRTFRFSGRCCLCSLDIFIAFNGSVVPKPLEVLDVELKESFASFHVLIWLWACALLERQSRNNGFALKGQKTVPGVNTKF